MLQISWRFRTDIDDHVPDRAANAPDELRLGRWRQLIMHAANCSLGVIERKVRLNHLRLQSVLGEFLRAKRTAEKPAVILFPIKLDYKRTGEFRFVENHASDFD